MKNRIAAAALGVLSMLGLGLGSAQAQTQALSLVSPNPPILDQYVSSNGRIMEMGCAGGRASILFEVDALVIPEGTRTQVRLQGNRRWVSFTGTVAFGGVLGVEGQFGLDSPVWNLLSASNSVTLTANGIDDTFYRLGGSSRFIRNFLEGCRIGGAPVAPSTPAPTTPAPSGNGDATIVIDGDDVVEAVVKGIIGGILGGGN